MIRQIIIICLVAVFAYYAGANGLTVSKVMDWFDEREITQTVEDVYNKTIEIAEQKKIVDKTTDVIDSL
jgi:arsenate reductase-like glutaredoxin family protein